MTTAILIASFGAAVLLLLARLAWISLKYSGPLLVTCPENTHPAGVALDTHRLAWTSDLRLDQCSRWPERQGCGQACLSQVAPSPADCMVRTILAKWCAGKTCALCGRPIGEVHLTDHTPAVLNAERRTVAWSDLPAENVPSVIENQAPVCWNCHIVATFRCEHPELVVDRSRPAQ